MTIDVRTPEDERRELRNISLLQCKKHCERFLEELDWLISSTATGERRNTLTEININLSIIRDSLFELKSEEKEE